MTSKKTKRLQIMVDATTEKQVKTMAERLSLTPSEVGYRILRSWLSLYSIHQQEGLQRLMLLDEPREKQEV